MNYRIRLAKENFKFSVSHFTIFGPEEAERLHGHNYYVSAELLVEKLNPSLGLAFDFNAVKPLLAQICKALDEYVLLPENSPYLKVNENGFEVEALFRRKRYVFPSEDVKILPVCNVTSEELARWVGLEFVKAITLLRKDAKVSQIAISVEETRGQSVTWSCEPPDEI